MGFIVAYLKKFFSLSLGIQILIFLILGMIAGIVFGKEATLIQPLGDLFIRLLMMAAIPLVFFNLVAGLTSLPDARAFGRIGLRIILYYVATTIVALTLGLWVTHWLKPGVGMQWTSEIEDTIGQVPKISKVILDMVPENVFSAFSGGQVAQVVLFAVFLGIAILLMPGEQRLRLNHFFDLLAVALRKLVHIIMYFGPIGIGALAAATVGEYGAQIFGPLLLFIAGIWGAQLVMVVFYMVMLYSFTKWRLVHFLKQTAPLYATTAATCSSLASLAVSLEIAEERMKLPKSVYSFTLPFGAQMNKDGTAIMLAAILLFTAQAAGIEFSLTSQITIILIGLILSNGSGGIPGGGLVIALIFVKAFQLPLEIAAIVAGIYRLIDMGSTTINCMGDMVGTVIVAHFEK